MSEEIMTQFKTEGQPLFDSANKENDTSSDSSSEKTNIDQSGSSDQNKDSDANKNDDDKGNFADHPRWKEREDDWKSRFNEQEKRHSDELAKLRDEFNGKFKEHIPAKPSEETVEVPSWFGGDETQWQEFQKWNQSLVSKAKTDALNELESKTKEEQKSIEEATTYFQEEVGKLETDKTINPNGDKVDRNKLLKFVLDNDLVDSKGRWNYRAGFMMMKSSSTNSKNNAIDEKKKIASATTSENRSETKTAPFTTSADFSKPNNRPW
jgi:hypothetical protein